MTMASGPPRGAERMTRAPSDVLRLGVATTLLLIVIVIGWVAERTIVDNAARAAKGVDALSAGLLGTLATLAELVGILVLGLGVAVAVARRQWLLIASTACAALVAIALVGLATWLLGAEVEVAEVGTTPVAPGAFVTAAGLAAVTAFVTAAGPWASRRWRRAAWFVVIALTIARVMTAPVSFETAIALLAGW